MCGLLGGFWPQYSSSTKKRVEQALVSIIHRGPDDSGIENYHLGDAQLVLAHTRLSIIDLSDAGHQPMSSADGRYALVFNGEIYNYKELRKKLVQHGRIFVTDSDTEVLLHSWVVWGEGCISRLKGMFSFVVYDKQKQYLYCVRDAFGIKPFFYYWNDGDFAFSSEVQSLITCVGRQPESNLQRAYDYLVLGHYDDHENTFYQEVKHLKPGHLLRLDLGRGVPSIKRWWWPSIEENTHISFSDAVDQFRQMFLDNVKLHLRSDVPLGAALSGGLDSSGLVCAMRHLEPDIPIHTFSYIARGSVFNEEKWVDLVNNNVRAVSHKVSVTSSSLAADLDCLIKIQGEPFGSSSIYAQYKVFGLAKEHGVTVTLDGQGADELLAGYSGYPGARLRSLLANGDISAMIHFVRAWSSWPGRTIGQGIADFAGYLTPVVLRGFAFQLLGRSLEPSWLDLKKLKDHDVFPLLEMPSDFIQTKSRSLSEVLRLTQSGKGLAALLRHGDRNSMNYSIESRVPFLTTDMAEFLLTLPENYLISSKGETKHIFRAAMRGIVPDLALGRKDKVGFNTPEKVWLQQLGSTVLSWLDAAEDIPFLDAQKCRQEVVSVIESKKAFSFQAWRLINYCRWVQLNNMAFS